MPRPTFIVAEPEPEQALSTRKLVLETAKYNVLTAYSGRETVELAQQFPKVDALVIHSELDGMNWQQVVKEVRKIHREMPVVLLSAGLGVDRKLADHTVSSYEPEELLHLVRGLFGDPRPSPSRRIEEAS
ncbi:MAG TPA: response regulator [Terriglobales bacterium]|nr:response regulator [Terriglobales bacterium]